MTLNEQFKRAQEGQGIARDGLRKGGNDMMLDHWASRLMFWKDEERRLRNLSTQADLKGATLAQQYGQTEEGDAA